MPLGQPAAQVAATPLPSPSPLATVVPVVCQRACATTPASRLPVDGANVVWITFLTVLPWTVVAVFDAIDRHYRRRPVVVARLALSTSLLVVAYAVGGWFVVLACPQRRWDEVSTVLVTMFFNWYVLSRVALLSFLFSVECARQLLGWLGYGGSCPRTCFAVDVAIVGKLTTIAPSDPSACLPLAPLADNTPCRSLRCSRHPPRSWLVARNIRGWTQLLVLRRLDAYYARLLRNFFVAVPAESHTPAASSAEEALLATPLATLRISSSLIDNDLNSATRWLNPLDPTARTWARAFWLAWWTQDTALRMRPDPPASYDLTLHPRAYDLPVELWPASVQGAVDTGRPGSPVIRNADEWACALMVYGDEPLTDAAGAHNPRFPGTHAGMQDTAGAVPRQQPLLDTSSLAGVATLVYEKTAHVPHRMTSLWYGTSTFSDRYAAAAQMSSAGGHHLRVPSLHTWRRMAVGIGERAPVPLFLSGADLENYACELAAASVLLTNYAAPFAALVEQIYQDGRAARWTFGWSGLLSCFSNLWTPERVHIAACNGLSLLALQCAPRVAAIPDCVRSMLVAYVSYAVSARAVGRRIAPLRQAELLRRYRANRARTCRGSGVDAIRRACTTLRLPAVASHMDGLPAFTAGWCLEYMERQPGNQPPAHGADHDEVERRLGSGTAWRYPSESTFE